MFEARIVEQLPVSEAHGARTPQPKHLLRIGLTLESSSLFLADGTDNICFDTEGFFTHGKNRTRAGQKLLRDQTVALVVNLEEGSPNQNTVSLFVNGSRASKPQKIPENLRGKVLYPTITYRNISLEVNLGPIPRKALPFTCHMLAAAAVSDVAQTPKSPGKKECIFPIGLPEQGYFDWVDQFVEKNPGHVELSDRKLIEWAFKSGLGKPKKGRGRGEREDLLGQVGMSRNITWVNFSPALTFHGFHWVFPPVSADFLRWLQWQAWHDLQQSLVGWWEFEACLECCISSIATKLCHCRAEVQSGALREIINAAEVHGSGFSEEGDCGDGWATQRIQGPSMSSKISELFAALKRMLWGVFSNFV